MYDDFDLRPPGTVAALTWLKADHHLAPIVVRAANHLPKIVVRLKIHRMAVVEIDRAAAVVARIDVQIKRPGRLLRRALHQRLARQDGPRADEHREIFKTWRFTYR